MEELRLSMYYLKRRIDSLSEENSKREKKIVKKDY